ncbi:MAG: DUF3540 domain-containing protein [Byssovorax sp.]
MDATTAILAAPLGALTTARVTSVGEGSALAVESRAFGRGRARVAVASDYAPRAGDTVLVATCDDGARYVIGVISAPREATTSPAAATFVEARDGSRAALEATGSCEAIRVRDGRGRLLFEHNAEEGRSIVHVPEGDLDLVVPGSVRISAGAEIALTGARITMKADHADVRVDEARFAARALSSTVDHVLQVVETLEVRAGRVIERAKETYREVEGLAQTRAGRLRLVAEETLHLLGRRAQMKAHEDLKLKGEKIYLA